MSRSTGAIFPTAFAHFLSLCHIFVILKIFKLFHYYYICFGVLRSVVSDVTVVTLLEKDYDLLEAHMVAIIFKLRHVHFFRPTATENVINYSIV